MLEESGNKVLVPPLGRIPPYIRKNSNGYGGITSLLPEIWPFRLELGYILPTVDLIAFRLLPVWFKDLGLDLKNGCE